MSGFPRVQKHPLLRGGIKGGGRLKRVNFAPHGTLVHRRRSSQRPKMPIICRIELRNPSYGGGLLPPHRMHGRDKRSPVIASSFAWRSAFHYNSLRPGGQNPCAVPQGGFALGRPARSWGTMSPHPPRAVSTRPNLSRVLQGEGLQAFWVLCPFILS